ncbi:RDD family protein [Mycobacterium antarcticum]|uniref:RDD family protein n=1 Tax=unclassified Mycolicibacterium TaxID=2636767 RepID=UPI002388E3B3|nr:MULTISPECIES: RDD family protein [unclassified Mycolicibacterium]BDX31640.1 RDD family protein [Mycolicibacterium sp. TUM20985]GLP74937.1 RDD family protein [Mycolicibacterium sp. TUM20983]GLP80726.1 RDD family protein [Mycolicibacterium sp. TUM20984]
MARTFGSWLSGPPPSEAGDASQGPNDFPGQRLGLPESGSGSLSGVGRRIVALMIDWFIAYGLASLAVTVGLVSSDRFFGTQIGSTAVMGVWLVLGVLSVRLFGFTPGQYAVGLRVASVDHRMHVGLGRALCRGLLVAVVVPALFTDADGRGFQDRLTGTAVVRR